jgi:hypothetical protein
MNGVTHHAAPWTLAANRTLTDLLELKVNRTTGGCEWRRFHCELSEQERLDAAAWLVADEIVSLRCNQAQSIADLWVTAAKGEAIPEGADLDTIRPFIEPSFGLPPNGIASDHGQGYVAEIVWRMLAKEQQSPGRELIYLARPDPDVHSPGADGFAIYKQGDEFVYRLWEIKKRGGGGALSPTISAAYSQLAAKAERYLAKVTALSEVDSNDELAATFGQLVPRWKRAHPSAGVGVAVAADTTSLPVTAFSTMHQHFPAIAANEGCLEGCLVGLGNFAEFCDYVRTLLWNGLSNTTP